MKQGHTFLLVSTLSGVNALEEARQLLMKEEKVSGKRVVVLYNMWRDAGLHIGNASINNSGEEDKKWFSALHKMLQDGYGKWEDMLDRNRDLLITYDAKGRMVGIKRGGDAKK